MRVALLAPVASAIVLLNATLFLACGDDPATVVPDAGGIDGGGQDGQRLPPDEERDSSTTPDADSGGFDAGPDAKRAPNGCLLFTTGHKSGTVAESVPRTDIDAGNTWTTPEGALTEDSTAAMIVLGDGEESAELVVRNFGITLPPGAETWGIIVELKRQTQTDGGVIRTRGVDLTIDGKDPTAKFDSQQLWWPTRLVGRHGYGREDDTWSVDLLPADVTSPTFAARLWAAKSLDAGPPGPIAAIVDSLKVAVWYATGPASTCQK